MRVFIRQVQSGPQTISSAGGVPPRAISRVISRCSMPPASPLARRRTAAATLFVEQVGQLAHQLGHLAAQH